MSKINPFKKLIKRNSCLTKGFVMYQFTSKFAISFEQLELLSEEIAKDFPEISADQLKVCYTENGPALMFYTEKLNIINDPNFQYVKKL